MKCGRCGGRMIELTTHYQGYVKYQVMCENAFWHALGDKIQKIKDWLSWTKTSEKK
jgi:hypothetical protein